MSEEVLAYFFDVFHKKKTDLKKEDVLQAFREDKRKPFELVRDIVEKHGVTAISSVEFYDSLIEGDEFLIEYLVEFSNGKIAVKLVASENPQEMISRYYEYKKTKT